MGMGMEKQKAEPGFENAVEEILASAEKGEAKYVVVEKDQWYDDSLELGKKEQNFFKRLGI